MDLLEWEPAPLAPLLAKSDATFIQELQGLSYNAHASVHLNHPRAPLGTLSAAAAHAEWQLELMK